MIAQPDKKPAPIFVLTPIVGTIAFVVLYVVATLFYPGGSDVDKNAAGFSWLHNYWCNLLNDIAINGQPNQAKPIAITAMLILCITLSYFWFLFPKYIRVHTILGQTIQLSGALAMVIAFLLFTQINHDLVTNMASLFGVIATVGTFIGLYQVKWIGLFAFGLVNLLLVALNNYVYHSQGLTIYLPVLQKISFASFLIWICCINWHIYRLVYFSKKFVDANAGYYYSNNSRY